MIALWMLYATLIALLMGAAAMAAEHLCHVWRFPRRFVWAAAIAGSAVLPVASLLAPRESATLERFGAVMLPARIVAASAETLSVGALTWLRAANALLVAVWGAASLTLLIVLIRRQRALKRARAEWREAEVAGYTVLVSEETGPAVFGARRPKVVLPHWTLALDEPLLSLVVRHEREHARVRDPLLLTTATLMTIGMPWNIASWWQLRRLRLALELDCDRRVLSQTADVRRYATLLLAVGQRLRSSSLALVTLGEPAAHLTRRITIMSASRPRHPWLHSAVVAPIALLALIVACEAPNPGAPAAATVETIRAEQVPTAEPSPNVASPESQIGGRANGVLIPIDRPDPERAVISTKNKPPAFFEFQVEEAVTPAGGTVPRFPDALRAAGVEGEVLAQFVVDETGRPVAATFKVLKSAAPEFSEAVRAALPGMRFTAARIKGRNVRQLVQQPFMFALANRKTSSAGHGSTATHFALWAPMPASPTSIVSSGC